MSSGSGKLVTALILMVTLPMVTAGTQAPGPGSTPASLTNDAAPGPLLAYHGHDGFDAGYTKLATALGTSLVETTTWPGDLATYGCVVLSAPTQPFEQALVDELGAYLDAGGTLLALAETPSFDGGDSVASLQATLSGLGADLGLVATAVDRGFLTTTEIPAIAPTAGVADLEYAGSAEVTVAGDDVGLARTVAGPWLVGVEPIGQGALVVAGDANMFSDSSFHAFSDRDNGRLAENLCTGVATELEAKPLLGDPASPAGVHAPEMRAVLVTEDGGRAVPGQLVTFQVEEEPVCQAVTDEDGQATCNGLAETSQAALAGGYEAHAHARFIYHGAQAPATLLGVGGNMLP